MKDSIIPKNIIDRNRIGENRHNFDVDDYNVKSYGTNGNIVNFYKTNNDKYLIIKKPLDGYFISIDRHRRENSKIKRLVPINRLERDLHNF